MLNFFWKRDRIAHGLVKESEVDLQSLCEAARFAVEHLAITDAENRQLRERIDDAVLERRDAIAARGEARRELDAVIVEAIEVKDQRDRAVKDVRAITVERDAALAEAKRLQAA